MGWDGMDIVVWRVAGRALEAQRFERTGILSYTPVADCAGLARRLLAPPPPPPPPSLWGTAMHGDGGFTVDRPAMAASAAPKPSLAAACPTSNVQCPCQCPGPSPKFVRFEKMTGARGRGVGTRIWSAGQNRR